MDIKSFRNVIKERIECHDEDYYCIESCWEKEVSILCEDISSTIIFLKSECTADEYSWISEVIDDVAAITKSRELIEVFKALMKKFPEECEKYNIKESIKYAEIALEDEEDDGEE